MKKNTPAFIAFLILGLVVSYIGISGDEPLEPGVAEVLALGLPEAAPEDNAYVGLSGLGGLQDGDVVTAGIKYLASRPWGQEGEAEQGPKFDYSYRNPCLANAEDNCLDQMLADAAVIEAAFDKYDEILKRYYVVRDMPLYVNTSGFSGRVPSFQTLVNVSKLVGDKALLDIKRGDLSGGLDSLEKDLGFAARMGRSEYISIIDLMISAALVARNQMLLGAIIGDGRLDLAGEEERLRKMLDLGWDPSRMMVSALGQEKRRALLDFESMPHEYQGRESDLKEKLAYAFLYKRNMTLNRIAGLIDEAVSTIQAAPLLNFPDFFDKRKTEYVEGAASYESGSRIKNLYDKNGLFFFKNHYGDLLIDLFAENFYISYLGRLNDTLVRSRLTRAQLELRLMDNRPEDVSEALAHLGLETLNPYTGQPFEWDKDNDTLWAELSATTGEGQGETRKRVKARVPRAANGAF